MRCTILLSILLFGSILPASAAERRRPVHHTPAVPTYSADLAPIFVEHCSACHRPGGVGPFSLLDYETTYAYRHLIRFMTETRRMPPWKASLECGDWKDPDVLSDREIAMIRRWVDAGAPEGNEEHLPPPPSFEGGWTLGEPDRILEVPSPHQIARTQESWRCFVFPVGDDGSRFLAGVEILNDATEDVHHMIAYLDTSGNAARLAEADSGEGYDYMKWGLGFEPAGVIGLYTPGERPFLLPEGIAIEIPEGAHIVLQVHYHPHDEEHAMDRPRIGLHRAGGVVEKRLGFMAVYNGELFIPANQKDVLVEARQQVTEPISILSMGGHMHYLGQRISIRAVHPDGVEHCLLEIDDWDQRWQGMYRYREPVKIPMGSEIVIQGWYDNTSENPRSPHDPPVDIYWGESADDEMLQGYLTFTRDLENLYIVTDP